MPSSRPEKKRRNNRLHGREPCDFTQLALDFVTVKPYSVEPRKETAFMNQEFLETLENKITLLLEKYTALKQENERLAQENESFIAGQNAVKARIDALIGKLEGI